MQIGDAENEVEKSLTDEDIGVKQQVDPDASRDDVDETDRQPTDVS